MKQLLVIARDSGVQRAFEAALSDIPCTLLLTSDIVTALGYLESRPIDLVFLDLQGLAADGLCLLQLLRSRGNPVPVFVATTPADLGVSLLRAAASRGIHYEIMRKPLDRGDIRAATAAVLAT